MVRVTLHDMSERPDNVVFDSTAPVAKVVEFDNFADAFNFVLDHNESHTATIEQS